METSINNLEALSFESAHVAARLSTCLIARDSELFYCQNEWFTQPIPLSHNGTIEVFYITHLTGCCVRKIIGALSVPIDNSVRHPLKEVPGRLLRCTLNKTP